MILTAFCLAWLICAFSLILGHTRFADRFAPVLVTQPRSDRRDAFGESKGAPTPVKTLAASGNVLSAGSIEHCSASTPVALLVTRKSTNRLASAHGSAGALFSNTGLFLGYPDNDVAVTARNPGDDGKSGIVFTSPAEHMDAAILTADMPQPANLALPDFALARPTAGSQQVAA